MRKIILCVLFCCFSFYASNTFATRDVIKFKGGYIGFDYYIPNYKKLPSDVLVLVPGYVYGSTDANIPATDIGWIKLAKKKNWAIVSLAPFLGWHEIFSNSKRDGYSEYWSGNVLNTVLGTFSSKGIHIKSVYIYGVSDGARFALTYSLLYPDKVKKAAIVALDSNVPITKYVPVKFFYVASKNGYPHGKIVGTKNLNTFARQAKVHNIDVSYKIYEQSQLFSHDKIHDAIDFFE